VGVLAVTGEKSFSSAGSGLSSRHITNKITPYVLFVRSRYVCVDVCVCMHIQVCPVSAAYHGPPKIENERNKRFVIFKTLSKPEWDVRWWNPVAQTRLVLDSSSFAPVLTLHHRTCFHSTSSVLAVRISCRVIALFVFRKPLSTNKFYRIYVCYTNITLY
jgi:hypothetical protein